MKHALIYLRVSTTSQVNQGLEPDGFSIPAQRRACMRYAETLGATSFSEFVDRGESGRSTRRPGLQALLQALTEERPDLVVVHKIDRLARNLHDDVAMRLAIRQAGAELVSATEQVDNSPSGQLFHNLLAGMNEFYSANLAAEALKGATEKARQGGTPYRVPIGYRNVSRHFNDREIRTVELDPERAHHVRWAFEAYATGEHSLRSLRLALSERGLRPRRTGLQLQPLSTSLLAHLLANRYYLGLVPYNGREYPGRHEPLVSPATFAAVQLVLQSHRHGERRQAHQHPLKGRVSCGRCRSPLGFSRAKGRYAYFFCRARHRDHSCELPYLPADQVEAAVQRELVDLQLSDGQRRHLVGAMRRELATVNHHFDEQTASLEARRARLDRERARLMQAFYSDRINVQLFGQEHRRIDKEHDEVETQMAQLLRQGGERGPGEAAALELARTLDLSEAFAAAPDQVKRFLLQACFQRLALDDHGTLTQAGHGLQHRVVVSCAVAPRTLEYRQLVYGLLLLAQVQVG